jgi:cytochrome c oxidase subunit IV
MKKTYIYAWMILLALSLFAFLLGYLEYINTLLVSILLVSTFIKGQLLIDHFMGLKNVKLKYRLIPSVWLLVVLTLIGVAYYVPL